MKYCGRAIAAALLVVLASGRIVAHAAGDDELQRGLIGHWPLAGNSQDVTSAKRHGQARGELAWAPAAPHGGASFNGRDAQLEVANAPRCGTEDFSIALWVQVDPATDDVPGDLLSLYDAQRNRGLHLTLKTSAGVTTNQANFRQLQFGIDNDRNSDWIDCGRPGRAILAFGLVAFDGALWAGTCESGKGETGHVYRYAGGTEWVDCGSPAPCNAVTAMAEFDGKLYVGVGKYRLAGSALPESENPHAGGGMFRYDDGKWIACGQLPGVEAVGGLVVFQGKLHASSLYRPAGFFRYEGGEQWTTLPTPEGKRVEALAVYNGLLYASTYDGGRIYRFDGSAWTDCGELGQPNENSQTYSFAIHAGRLFVGTWPSGKVYRFEEVGRWTDIGRLGSELEVMGMLVHNGRLIAGTLPLAEVYEYRAEQPWRRLTRLDHTPEVKYRRAWTMAEHSGRLYCSTLPSGRVFAFEAGKSATWDRAFPAGWHHVTATRAKGELQLYVDGQRVARSAKFDPSDYDLTVDAPLRIGFGESDFFRGQLADLRWYARALGEAEVRKLARRP